jgi:tetratricopeptide (TPR) repeat protein
LAGAITRLVQATGLGEDGDSAWKAANRVVGEYQDVLLRSDAEAILGRYILARIDDLENKGVGEVPKWVVTNSLLEKWHLLERCREVGIDAAFGELEEHLVNDWYGGFLNFISWSSRANDWAATRDSLRDQYRELRRPRARGFLASAEWLRSVVLMESITLGELFARIKDRPDNDIDEAFEDLIAFGTDVPVAVRDSLKKAIDKTGQYRDSGDRMTLNDAIEHWERVLKDKSFTTASVHTQRTYRIEAGNVYEYRYRERADRDDLNHAIDQWEEAKKVNAHQERAESAEFLYYLGYSYERRHRRTLLEPGSKAAGPDGRTDLDRAIENYDRAYDAAGAATSGIAPAPVETDGPDAFTRWLWLRRQKARYRNAAGLAHLERYQVGQSARDLDAAVDLCRAATELAEAEESRAPFLYDDLGQVLAARAAAIGDPDDVQKALTAYERGLECCHGGEPLFGLETASHYGLLLYDLDDLPRARTALETAHAWAEESRRPEQTSHRTRQAFTGFNATLYETLVTCCLCGGDAESAFRYAVAAKGRSFVDALVASRVSLADVVRRGQAELEPYLGVRDDIEKTRARIDQPPLADEKGDLPLDQSLYEQLKTRRHEEKILWADLVSRHRELTAMQDGPPMPADDARRLADRLGVTMVEYYRHRRGWCAFVVTPDQVVCRSLPDVTDSLLDDLNNWVRDISRYDSRDPGNDILTSWYDAVVRPIRADLTEGRPNIIAPFGRMHALPYCAALDRESSRYVQDEFELGFVPSLSALDRIWQRGATTSRPWSQPVNRVLGVAYPDPPGREPLTFAKQEVAAVFDCFDRAQATELVDGDATPDEVIARAAEQDLVHISCHGRFEPRFPSQTGLILSEGWLTTRRIATEMDLSTVRLFTMSACSTAESDLGPGDELEGLTQAAMTAGAPTVVASLWPVNERATEVLLASFYRNLANGSTPIQAMRVATRGLREHENWNHPYYWCGFIVSGLGALPLGPPAGAERSDGRTNTADQAHRRHRRPRHARTGPGDPGATRRDPAHRP